MTSLFIFCHDNICVEKTSWKIQIDPKDFKNVRILVIGEFFRCNVEGHVKWQKSQNFLVAKRPMYPCLFVKFEVFKYISHEEYLMYWANISCDVLSCHAHSMFRVCSVADQKLTLYTNVANWLITNWTFPIVRKTKATSVLDTFYMWETCKTSLPLC